MNRFGFALNLNEKEYHNGLPLAVLITAVNSVNEETTLTFSGGDLFTVAVISGNNEIYSFTKSIGGSGTQITLPPQGLYTFDHLIDSSPDASKSVTIEVTLHCDEYPFTSTLSIPLSNT